MPRIRLLASSLALALCSVTAAQAQQFTSFSNVFSFGDSLSDAGNIAALEGLPGGNSFTTNPDPVSVQLIASAFGHNLTNISPFIPGSSGGTDYAYGGACVQANSESFTCALSPGSFSITDQVIGTDPGNLGYLASHGGKADPNALYTMWGGANDLFTYAGLLGAGAITPTQAGQGVGLSAATEGGLIGALQHAGARNILVFNLPNIAVTPDANAQATAAANAAAGAVLAEGGTPDQAAAAAKAAATQVLTGLTQLSLIYNNELNATMAGRTGIIPVNVFGLVNEVLASPSAYGFSNTTGMACSTGPGVGGNPSSVACGPASAAGQLPYTYAPGTNLSYFFADGVHPTGAGHALLAEYVLAEIAAPAYASMLPEAPLQTFETQNRTTHDQMQADLARSRPEGTLRSFAAFDYSRDRFDQTATSPQTSVRNETLVFGSDYYVSNYISFGLTTTLSHQDASFAGGGGFQNNEPMIAAWGLWHTQDYWFSALGSVGQLNFNGINRVIQLGAQTRTETASTGGSHVGFELGGGYLFHWADINSGPFATFSHQRVRVSSYNENGSDSTTMFFGRQNRDSTIWRVGWELTGDSKMMGGDWHPYARVAYDHETDDKARSVDAGILGMNGTFTMPGFQPDGTFWTGELGVAADFGSNLSAFAGYDGKFGNANERVDSFNLGIKWKW